MKRMFITYNPILTERARYLRNNSTKSEIKLWKFLKGKQMQGFDFHRQKPVGNYILDFFCKDLMLGIELDGITHLSEGVYASDVHKETYLNSINITVLRFTDDEVFKDFANVLGRIEGWILENKPAPEIL